MRYYLWPADGVPLQNLPHRYVVKLTPLENRPESEQELQDRAVYSLLNGLYIGREKILPSELRPLTELEFVERRTIVMPVITYECVFYKVVAESICQRRLVSRRLRAAGPGIGFRRLLFWHIFRPRRIVARAIYAVLCLLRSKNIRPGVAPRERLFV
jgi:hypothetical protein